MLTSHLVSKQEEPYNFLFLLLISISFPLGYHAENNSFYASLHAGFTQKNSQMTTEALKKDIIIEYRFVKLFLDNLSFIFKLKTRYLVENQTKKTLKTLRKPNFSIF